MSQHAGFISDTDSSLVATMNIFTEELRGISKKRPSSGILCWIKLKSRVVQWNEKKSSILTPKGIYSLLFGREHSNKHVASFLIR